MKIIEKVLCKENFRKSVKQKNYRKSKFIKKKIWPKCKKRKTENVSGVKNRAF